MKLGIIIDSSAGLTKKETESKGWGFLPLYISVDGKEYADGVDISAKEYYKMIKIEMDVKTSATPPAMAIDLFEKMSKEYDQVIVYPLSKELSSQFNNLTTFSKEFNNVHVIESNGVGTAIVSDIEVLKKMNETGASIDEIVAKANEITKEQYGILVPKRLDWLVKGGRITPGIASMAKMMKIIPMIAFKDGKLEKYGKARVFKKAAIKAAQAVVQAAEGKDMNFTIYDGGNEDIQEIKEAVESMVGHEVTVTDWPPVIGNHTGPAIVAIISSRAK